MNRPKNEGPIRRNWIWIFCRQCDSEDGSCEGLHGDERFDDRHCHYDYSDDVLSPNSHLAPFNDAVARIDHCGNKVESIIKRFILNSYQAQKGETDEETQVLKSIPAH